METKPEMSDIHTILPHNIFIQMINNQKVMLQIRQAVEQI